MSSHSQACGLSLARPKEVLFSSLPPSMYAGVTCYSLAFMRWKLEADRHEFPVVVVISPSCSLVHYRGYPHFVFSLLGPSHGRHPAIHLSRRSIFRVEFLPSEAGHAWRNSALFQP